MQKWVKCCALTFGKKDEGEPETRKRRSAREREGLSQRRAQKKKERESERVCLFALRAFSLFLRLLCVAQRRKKEKRGALICARADSFTHPSLSQKHGTRTPAARENAV